MGARLPRWIGIETAQSLDNIFKRRGRLLDRGNQRISKLPQQQPITALEIDPKRAFYLAMMPHCCEGAMSVSQGNFLDHVDKGAGYFGTFFNAMLMTPPRCQTTISGMRWRRGIVSHPAAHW